jgi:hypothetical protein
MFEAGVKPQAVGDRECDAAGPEIFFDWCPRRWLRLAPDPKGYFLLPLLISLDVGRVLLLRPPDW